MSILLKLAIGFLIQSFLFFIIARRMNEENNILWDIYFTTGIPAVIFSLLLSYFFNIFFPIYFFSLMFMFYYVRSKWYQDKNMKNLFLYFSINVYSAVLIYFLVNFDLNIKWLLPFSFITLLIFLFVYFKHIYLGMYLLPLIYLSYLFFLNPQYLNLIKLAFDGQFMNHIALIEMGFILMGTFVMLILEYKYNHFVFNSNDEKTEYEKIMYYRQLKNSSLKLPRGSI